MISGFTQNDKVKKFFTLCEQVVKKAKDIQKEDIKTAETTTKNEIKEERRKEEEKQLADEQTAKFEEEQYKVKAANQTYKYIIQPLLDFDSPML